MKMNHRELRKKMLAQKQEKREEVKHIPFPMPNLKKPEGNAHWLLGQAKRLMKQSGVDDVHIGQFNAEATSGDYKNLLRTIDAWFTVVVPQVTYAPLQGDITDLIVPDEEGDIPTMNDGIPEQEDEDDDDE